MKTLKDILTTKRGRIGFTIVALVLVVVLFGTIQRCRADGFGVAVAKEVTHDEATLAGFLDYTAPTWAVYVGQWDSARFRTDRNVRTAGAEYRAHLGHVYAGLGAAYVDQLTPLNGTRANFSLTIGYDFGAIDAFCRHQSHGSQLGLAPDKANGGWNWCGFHLSY